MLVASPLHRHPSEPAPGRSQYLLAPNSIALESGVLPAGFVPVMVSSSLWFAQEQIWDNHGSVFCLIANRQRLGNCFLAFEGAPTNMTPPKP